MVPVFRMLAALAACALVGSSTLLADDGTNDEPVPATELALNAAAPQEDQQDPDDDWGDDADLAGLEALMRTQVTSVSGVGEDQHATPAAIHVITGEDIRRGGYRSIPEALRGIPGLSVSQLSSSVWSVGSRGFTGRTSDTLLVLVDGRAVYNDIFSGVIWDEVNVPLHDIDRIEVIRGPGATIWGANAVNGVINIVTKRARDTQGGVLVGGGGDHEEGFGTVRYGDKINEDLFYRAHLKYTNRDEFRFASGGRSGDDWDMISGGFRAEYEGFDDKVITLQGGLYNGRVSSPFLSLSLAPPFAATIVSDDHVRGGNLVARVEHNEEDGSGWSVQAYYDRDDRSVGPILDNVLRETFDLEFRQFFPYADQHSIIWGLGYRNRNDRSRAGDRATFDPEQRRTEKFSAFIQDTIEVIPDRFRVMIGTKYEYNDYSQSEVQPSLRAAWTPTDKQTIWASVARAVRTPARLDQDLTFVATVVPPPGGPAFVNFVADPGTEAEELFAYELGYRVQPSANALVDIALFHNDFDKVTGQATTANPLVISLENDSDVKVYGAEASCTYRLFDWWEVRAQYTWQKAHTHGIADVDSTTPEHQAALFSRLDLCSQLEFNSNFFYADHVGAENIPSYVRLDAGLTWHACPNVSVSLWGQNLTDSWHQEGLDQFQIGSTLEVPRALYGEISIRF